jgi:hypothetical protein
MRWSVLATGVMVIIVVVAAVAQGVWDARD